MPPNSTNSSDGIISLELACNNLKEQEVFYGKVLELTVRRLSEKKLIVTAGKTTITFYEDEKYKNPIYHFAFNIPENKLEAAIKWLKLKGVTLNKRSDGSEIYHFINWNAHAVYFLDPAGNVVEFIARHNLSNSSGDKFSPASILYASEIGLVVNDVEKQVLKIKNELGFDIYKVNTSNFAAIGNEYNLLIMVSVGRPWLGGTVNIPAQTFPVTSRLGASIKKASLQFNDHPFSIFT